MHTARRGSKLLPHIGLLATMLYLAACGGVTAFQGQSALSVVGTPPAPPAPAPAPPAPEPAPPARVEVRDNKIEIKEKIQFAYNKATILEQSFSLMDEIAALMVKHPHLKKIAIEGHASSEGDAAHNVTLSDARAKAVMTYLVGKGVDAGRLTAKGFGAKRPIADNDSEEGREKNRRVEFLILEQDITEKKVEVDHTGKEKVLEEKQTTVKKDEPAPATDAALPAPKKPAAPKKADGK